MPGGSSVESPDPDTWVPIVERPLLDRKSGEAVYAEKAPEDFLRLLAENVRGTSLFATEPHEDEACPYLHHPLVSIESVEGSRELERV